MVILSVGLSHILIRIYSD